MALKNWRKALRQKLQGLRARRRTSWPMAQTTAATPFKTMRLDKAGFERL